MTLSPRPRFLARFSGLSQTGRLARLAGLIALAAAATIACENKHIGRRCDLAVPDSGAPATGSEATINPEALECPSRICLSPGAEKTTNTGALCTAECSSDDDCSDNEGTTNPEDPHCKSGFVCMVPTTVGNFCCKKLCVCKDFVEVPMGGFKTPAVCMPGSGGGCKNVE